MGLPSPVDGTPSACAAAVRRAAPSVGANSLGAMAGLRRGGAALGALLGRRDGGVRAEITCIRHVMRASRAPPRGPREKSAAPHREQVISQAEPAVLIMSPRGAQKPRRPQPVYRTLSRHGGPRVR